MANNPSFVAGAAIGPSLFLTFAASGASHTLIQAVGATLPIVGISGEGTREAPIPGVTPSHASTGEPVKVYGLGDVCEVIAGGTIDAGDFLTSDADGKAVAVSAGGQYGARALADCVSGARARVQVVFGQMDSDT